MRNLVAFTSQREKQNQRKRGKSPSFKKKTGSTEWSWQKKAEINLLLMKMMETKQKLGPEIKKKKKEKAEERRGGAVSANGNDAVK